MGTGLHEQIARLQVLPRHRRQLSVHTSRIPDASLQQVDPGLAIHGYHETRTIEADHAFRRDVLVLTWHLISTTVAWFAETERATAADVRCPQLPDSEVQRGFVLSHYQHEVPSSSLSGLPELHYRRHHPYR